MVAWPLTCKGLLGVLLVYVLPQLAASEIGVPLNKLVTVLCSLFAVFRQNI